MRWRTATAGGRGAAGCAGSTACATIPVSSVSCFNAIGSSREAMDMPCPCALPGSDRSPVLFGRRSRRPPLPSGSAMLIIVLLLLGACGGPSAPLDDQATRLNDRGVALMGRFDYPGAVQAFSELTARQPDWLQGQVNLAIATLNRQQDGDVEAALALTAAVLAKDARHVSAHYVSGLLHLYQGELEPAAENLSKVVEADPADAYAQYYLGQVLLQRGQFGDALARFEQASKRDPYLRSAYYAASTALRSLGRGADADAMLGTYQRFENNPRARLAEFKYTRMGPKAEVMAPVQPRLAAQPLPAGPVFGASRVLASLTAHAATPRLSVADVNADGVPDIFISGAGEHSNTLLLGKADGSVTITPHAFDAVENIVAVAWGDIDNDGLLDAYLCRNGASQLWRQTQAGEWQDVTAAMGLSAGPGQCADAAMVDADHDGDVDLFVVARDQHAEIFNNDRNGAFRRLSSDQPALQNGAAHARQLLATDIDGDQDLDLLVINDQPPHQVLVNDRMWAYHQEPRYAALEQAPLLALAAADSDADGQVELFGLDDDGEVRRWQPGSDGQWRATHVAQAPGMQALEASDVDGDGTPELVLSGPASVQVVASSDGTLKASTGGAASALTSLVGAGARQGPSLLAAAVGADGTVQLSQLPPGPGRHAFIGLSLSGRADKGAGMRSNAAGIGAQVRLRAGARWVMASSEPLDSTPGHSLRPLLLGLGGEQKADFVALTWSDGVYQTELDVQPGAVTKLVETQRQMSSCPVLFVWDGQRFRFVSDTLGVAALGYLTSPRQYDEPRPFEFLHLDAARVAVSNGVYRFKLTEPQAESAYLDAVRLHVYDLPSGWSMLIDERANDNHHAASTQPLFYRTALTPERVMAAGQDVTPVAHSADGQTIPLPPRDPRFIGLLQAPSEVVLEFGAEINPPDSARAHPVLVAHGWVQYPYSQTVFAAWQAGKRYVAPSLDARDADGRWHSVQNEFGYPGGSSRQISLPLTALPAHTVALRLRGTLEVHWDSFSVVYAESAPHTGRASLAASSVTLRKAGFAARLTDAHGRVDYDYTRRASFWDGLTPVGLYSAFGEVRALTANVDDGFAIIGPGEELDLKFPAMADADPGSTRHFVLELRGYTKDGDLYTRDGGTVTPLPHTAGIAPPLRAQGVALNAQYNLRFEGSER